MRIHISKLNELMVTRGWTKVELAEALEVKVKYLSPILRGKSEGGLKFIEGVLKFCQREGCDYQDFIDFADEMDE